MSRELAQALADYPSLLKDVRQRVRRAQTRAIMAVSAGLNTLYREYADIEGEL